MARPKKYNEETVMFSMRVPKSKFDEVGKLVRGFLDNIKPEAESNVIVESYNKLKKDYNVVDDSVRVTTFEGTIARKIINGTKKELPKYEEVYNFKDEISKDLGIPKDLMFQEIKCDCILDSNGLLRRGKIRCIKPKSEHKF